jgi:hypothetical protein
MAVESARQDVKVSFGQDFVIMGGDRVEVSPDGKKVTAYTNDGVEIKALSGESNYGFYVSRDFNTVALNGATIERAADGHLVIFAPGTVITKPGPANDGLFVPPVASSDASRLLAKAATHEIGAIETTGEHKGEIYGGIYPADNKPIWFSEAPKLLDHYAAAAWASGQGGSLPTRKQGDYLTTLKGKLEICPAPRTEVRCLKDCPAKRDGPDRDGAFKEIFNRGNSFPAGFAWLAEPYTYAGDMLNAWCQRLGDGDQYIVKRISELPVLCVRR